MPFLLVEILNFQGLAHLIGVESFSYWYVEEKTWGMPLEQCFSIIENGSGQDFDPYITDVFLDMKAMITNIVESS